jgi:hypothetical protein
MAKALFLGNSHVAAYKLAYDRMSGELPYDCAFYCARCADLAFTEVRDLKLVPTDQVHIEPDELQFFYADGGQSAQIRYVKDRVPFADVGQQFMTTGGSSDIDLEGVTALFYAGGTSPFDFRRLNEFIQPISDTLRNELLARLLGDRFLLRRQIGDIRAAAPHIRHYYIGAPLRKWAIAELNPFLREIVESNRSIISELSVKYLFDDVFVPGRNLLAADLVSTRAEFFERGAQQAETYQELETTEEDIFHVNSEYARVVFDEFITPHMAQASEAADV